MDRLFCGGGSATLSVTDNNRETRADKEDILALDRITRLVATSFCREHVVIRFESSHLRLGAAGSLHTC
jgi:hypothetical protein